MKLLIVRNRKIIILPLVVLMFLLLTTGCSGSTQSQTAASPPTQFLTSLEQALSNGKPTLAEFGRGTCESCKEMEPILNELSIIYTGQLNVQTINVDTYRSLTNRYRIMAIPTQVFFDSAGHEVTRHIGFFPKKDIIAELEKLGIK